ncbi:MAG: hypothetical protein U0263_33140 [Polyangiaceae bacterium]
MRTLSLVASLSLITLLAGCGGSSTEDGTGGASGGGGAGGSSGSGGSGGGTSGSGGGAGVGGGGAGGTGGAATCGPEAKKCSEPTDCALVTQDCCLCGMPELTDFQAVNQAYTAQCSCQGPVCDCATMPNPNLGATCKAGSCEGFDVRKVDALSMCSIDDDCTLRMGLTCCESCGSSESELIAVAKKSGDALHQAVCPSSPVGCPACMPQYPANKIAKCVANHCQVADK